MPQITFKPRAGGRTVQLVRHIYSPAAGRSTTVTVGSIRLDADPDELPFGVRLVDGQTLSDDDLRRIAEWLRSCGDTEASRRRAARAQRIEASVREQLARDIHGSDAFEHAADGLEKAAHAIETRARAATLSDERPRDSLRSPYLAVYRAWERFAAAAKRSGVAKQMHRRKSSPKPDDLQNSSPTA